MPMKKHTIAQISLLIGFASLREALFAAEALEAVCFPAEAFDELDLDLLEADLPPDLEFVAIKVHLREL